eukprot:4531335-Prymnesium_polylepis.1
MRIRRHFARRRRGEVQRSPCEVSAKSPKPGRSCEVPAKFMKSPRSPCEVPAKSDPRSADESA